MGKKVVALVGVLVVAAYAALLAVDALVLDPLAALPGRPLGSIYAELDRQGFQVAADVGVVVGIAVVGVVLAAALAVTLVTVRAPAFVLAAAMLGVLVLGAVASFWSGFALGMDVADAFGIGGEDHGPWAGVLYLTSLAALVALPFVLVVGQAAHVRRTAGSTQAV